MPHLRTCGSGCLRRSGHGLLAEASDEIQLALMALGDPVGEPATVVADAVAEVIVIEEHAASE